MAVITPNATIPALAPGDHLTRDEFERRYDAMPESTRAELIEGVVYMPPATRWDLHSSPHGDLLAWLGNYRAATEGVRHGDAASIRLDMDNEPQPDATMLILPRHGGRVIISDDNYVEGSPEFVAEISASSVGMDSNTKLRVYQRNGISEYLIWRVLDRQIDWYALSGGRYQLLQPGDDGIIRSHIFPGLWLDRQSMLDRRLADVLKVLNRGVSTPEHAEFCARLAQAKQKNDRT